MKKIRGAAEDLSQRLGLPEDLTLGAGKLTLVAGKQALVENHRGLLACGSERMVIRLPRGKLSLTGTGLSIQAMNHQELLIAGRLTAVEWE